MKTQLIVVAAAVMFVASLDTADAQGPTANNASRPQANEGAKKGLSADPAAKPIPRFSSPASTSDVRDSRMTTAELRQARALYRAQQRVARLEYNLWMGYEPLRPNWNSVPMMSSRYTNQRVYVPVYVYGR